MAQHEYQHRNAPDTGSSFRHRLGMYVSGVAIGLVLLGFFQMARTQERAQRERERRAESATSVEGRSQDRSRSRGPAPPDTTARSDDRDGVSG